MAKLHIFCNIIVIIIITSIITLLLQASTEFRNSYVQ